MSRRGERGVIHAQRCFAVYPKISIFIGSVKSIIIQSRNFGTSTAGNLIDQFLLGKVDVRMKCRAEIRPSRLFAARREEKLLAYDSNIMIV